MGRKKKKLIVFVCNYSCLGNCKDCIKCPYLMSLQIVDLSKLPKDDKEVYSGCDCG